MAGEALFAPLFREKLLEEIVYAAQPIIIYDKVSVKMPLDKGTAEYVKTHDDFPLTFKKTGPSAAQENDEIQWDREVAVTEEFSTAPEIPQRVIEDEDFKTISLYTDQIGLAYARKVNTDCITALDAGVGASTQQAVTGGVWSLAGADPIKDIALTKGKMEFYNYIPDTMVLNPLRFSELIVDSSFIVATSWSKEQLETGEIPRLYGMSLYRTSAAGTTVADLVDSDKYMWYFERKPLTVEMKESAPPVRSVRIMAHMRYAFEVIRAKAAGQVTGVA